MCIWGWMLPLQGDVYKRQANKIRIISFVKLLIFGYNSVSLGITQMCIRDRFFFDESTTIILVLEDILLDLKENLIDYQS